MIFVFAAVTSENQAMIGRREFATMMPGAAFLLMSRAAVVDFPAMIEAVRAGHIRAATDVFPEEPVAADDPVRHVPGLLLSAHRTGGTVDALLRSPHGGRGCRTGDASLPPQMCRRADPSVAARLRSKPVAMT